MGNARAPLLVLVLMLLVLTGVCRGASNVGEAQARNAEHGSIQTSSLEGLATPLHGTDEPAPIPDEPDDPVTKTPFILQDIPHVGIASTKALQALLSSLKTGAKAVIRAERQSCMTSHAASISDGGPGEDSTTSKDSTTTSTTPPVRSLLQDSSVDRYGCTADDRRRAGLGFVMECLQPVIEDYDDRIFRRGGYYSGRRRRRGRRGGIFGG